MLISFERIHPSETVKVLMECHRMQREVVDRVLKNISQVLLDHNRRSIVQAKERQFLRAEMMAQQKVIDFNALLVCS